MKARPILLSSAALLLMPLAARAALSLAPLFSDHAVLQRDKPLPVWGRADPGEKIAVTFHGQTVHATAESDGRWIVYLAPVPASAEPAELTVAGTTESTVVHDVLVGEVWLASGQSNMEWSVSSLASEELKLASVDLPLLRQLKIQRSVASAPADTVKTDGWQPATPRTVGAFSAVGYFFARDLQRKLGVPVGLINSSYGGTEIEAWMSDLSRQNTSCAATLDARWKKAMSEWAPERIAAYPAAMTAWNNAEEHAKATHKKNLLPWPQPPSAPGWPTEPGGLFNGMIAPLQPAAIRGIVWYQGESNVGRAPEYAELFKAMILAWRQNWGDPTVPFYFVQLPNYANGKAGARDWAQLRDAQSRALELPATGMAIAIDVGEANNLHPTHKLEVGRRLALLAMAQLYGGTADFSGPVFHSATPEGPALRVRFTHAGDGLVSHDRPVQALELAGADKVFYPATAKIQRDTLLVSSPKVKTPVAVRYAWSNAPVANLYNGSGLPAVPFRSDRW